MAEQLHQIENSILAYLVWFLLGLTRFASWGHSEVVRIGNIVPAQRPKPVFTDHTAMQTLWLPNTLLISTLLLFDILPFHKINVISLYQCEEIPEKL